MTMIVKIMSGGNTPDQNPNKPFSIISNVKSFHTFTENADGNLPYNYVELWIEDEIKTSENNGFAEHSVTYDVLGNVYIMNEAGKTIATWTPPVQ